MDFDEIDKIVILVEIDGNAHQVLSTKENKSLMLNMLARMDSGLKLSHTIQPLVFESPNAF